MSGAISISAAQSVFANQLVAHLPFDAPDVDVGTVIALGATDIRRHFEGPQLAGVLESYMKGIRASWALSIGLAGVAVLLSFLAPMKKLGGP